MGKKATSCGHTNNIRAGHTNTDRVFLNGEKTTSRGHTNNIRAGHTNRVFLNREKGYNSTSCGHTNNIQASHTNRVLLNIYHFVWPPPHYKISKWLGILIS